MNKGNPLGIRDSSGVVIQGVPVIYDVLPVKLIDGQENDIPYKATFGPYIREQIIRLLQTHDEFHDIEYSYDEGIITGFWVYAETWSVYVGYGPGERGSHFFAPPMHGLYLWFTTAYLARVTIFKRGVHYETKEYFTPEQTLSLLTDYIAD